MSTAVPNLSSSSAVSFFPLKPPPLHDANGGTRPSPAKTDRQRRDNPRLLRDHRLSFLPFILSNLSFSLSLLVPLRGLENTHSIFLFLRDICGHWIVSITRSQCLSFLDRDRERRCEEVAAGELLAGEKNIWISVCNAVSSGCVSSQAIIAVNCGCARCGLTGGREGGI